MITEVVEFPFTFTILKDLRKDLIFLLTIKLLNHARDLVWQDLKRPWIITGIKKSSKRKERLNEKCLKKGNCLNYKKLPIY